MLQKRGNVDVKELLLKQQSPNVGVEKIGKIRDGVARLRPIGFQVVQLMGWVCID